MTVRRSARAVAALAATLTLVFAPAQATHRDDHTRPAFTTFSVATSEYLPGVEADIYLPDRLRGRKVPVVVMVPGGGWQSADRTGLGQLAEAFAAQGVAVSNATYRIGGDHQFPVPPQDIRCAVDAAVAGVADAGLRPGKVVLLGHSSGAHLSSLAALGDEAFQGPCPYPSAEIDGWVGLSGFYDLTLVGEMAWTLLGGPPEANPEGYRLADPTTYLVDGRHHLDVLIMNSDADEFGITPDYAAGIAELLRDHGYQTRLRIVPGDHHATYQAPVVADEILRWLWQVEC